MPGGNGKKRQSRKEHPTALSRCARNASFAAVLALDAFASVAMGNMPLAMTRAKSAIEWLKEAQREVSGWLDGSGK